MRLTRKATIKAWSSYFMLGVGLLACFSLLPRFLPEAGANDPDGQAFDPVTLVNGLEHPWGLAFLPDGRMLVTERPGRLRMVENGRLHPQSIGGVPKIKRKGQGGLLDVALHPEFESNGWVYLSYSSADDFDNIGTTVGRGRLTENRLEDWQEIFTMQPGSAGGRHFGSRLVFDRDGYLFITLGDRGERQRAQLLDDHAGSVIRLHDDGRIPADNPFVNRQGALPEIFSFGHRNAQGAALHPVTGELWLHEHGPQGGDEVNIARAGLNYGWPVVTYGAEYVSGLSIGEGTQKDGMVQPLWHWVPSIAPSGMTFYTGDLFPDMKGDLLVGALKNQSLVHLQVEGNRVVSEKRYLSGELGRIRDVRTGPDGHIYLLTDANDGAIVRLDALR